MKKPFFSIIMPTHNRAWILAKTLDAILKQDFLDWELIIVDDGSADNSRDIVKEYTGADDRIKYLYQENAGPSVARQNGLQYATGEWVAYIDSDEEIYPYYLSRAKEWLSKNPQVKYAFAWNDRVLELHDQDHKLLTSIQDPATQLPLDQITLKSFANWEIKPCGTGIFHKRELMKDVSWDSSFDLMEDIDLLLQLGTLYPDNFGFIPTALFKQRQVFGVEGVCSNASYADWADAFEKLYKKHANGWFMEGQQWYPKKVKTYRERQRLYDKGEYPSNIKRIFADYFDSKANY